MELSSRLALVGLALGLGGSGVLTAQQGTAAAPSVQIKGFLKTPWGASSKEIAAQYGVALMDRPAGDTGQVLIYRDQVAGRPVLALFYVDRNKGLVRGVYTVPYGIGSDCEAVFNTFKTLLLQLYPSLKPVENRKHQDQALPFCDAATVGKASWAVDWVDPGSGNSAESRVAVAFAARGFIPAPPPR